MHVSVRALTLINNNTAAHFTGYLGEECDSVMTDTYMSGCVMGAS